MEDAATAEICRAQIWQWVRHGAKLDDGRTVTASMVLEFCSEQMQKLGQELGSEQFEERRFQDAMQILERMMTNADFPEFLTLLAYELID